METTSHAPVSPEQFHQPVSPQELLQPDAIGVLRDKQWQALADKIRPLALDQPKQASAENEFFWQDLRTMNNSFLDESNITVDDPKRVIYSDLLARYSIKPRSLRLAADGNDIGDAWEVNLAKDEHGNYLPSEREAYEAEWKQVFNVQTPEVNIPQTEQERATESLTALRTTFAELSAKRQGKLFSRENGKDMQAYREAERTYKAALAAMGKANLEQWRIDEPQLPKNEITGKLVSFILSEQNNLRRESVDKLENKRLSKFIKAITSGGRGVRIAKNIGLGVGTAVVAGGVTLLSGGLGVTVAGGIIASSLGLMTRAARGYATADAKHGRGMKQLSNDELTRIDNESNNQFTDASAEAEHVVGVAGNAYEQAVKKEQNKRKKSAAWALGSVVVGSTVGVVAGHVIHGGSSQAAIHNNSPALKQIVVPPVPEFDPGKYVNQPQTVNFDPLQHFNETSPNTVSPTDTIDVNHAPNAEHTPEKTPIKVHSRLDTPADTAQIADIIKDHLPGGTDSVSTKGDTLLFGPDASNIKVGEGWLQTMKDVGIKNPQDRYALIKELGPKLQNIKIGSGDLTLAYKMPNGDWGINMTPDGKMPKEALKLIRQAVQAKDFELAA